MSNNNNNINYTDAKVCQPEKRIHDICFFNWYQEEFMKGNAKDVNACQEQWDIYQECLQKKLKAWDLKDKIETTKAELISKDK